MSLYKRRKEKSRINIIYKREKNPAGNLGNFTMRFFGHKKTALSEEKAVKLWS